MTRTDLLQFCADFVPDSPDKPSLRNQMTRAWIVEFAKTFYEPPLTDAMQLSLVDTMKPYAVGGQLNGIATADLMKRVVHAWKQENL